MSEASFFNPPSPLRPAFEACRRHFLFAVGFSALVNLLYLTPTIYLMQVYDRVLPTGGMQTLIWISLLAVVAFIVLGAMNNFRVRLMVRASLRLERLLAPEVLERLFSIRTAPGAGMRLRILRDFDAFRQTINGPGFAALMDAPWTPIYIAVSFMLHPLVGLLSLISSAVLIFLAFLNERATRGMLHDANEAAAEAHAAQDGVSRRVDVVRALGMREALSNLQIDRRARAADIQSRANLKAGGYTSIIKALRLTFQSAVLGVAVVLAVQRQISPGAIIAASLLMGRALAPIDQLVAAWGGMVQGRDAYQNLIKLFVENPAPPQRIALPDPDGRLDVEGLTVSPAPGIETLADIRFALKPGEIVGVVGPSGCGKTTLLSCIAGARSYNDGTVRIGGANVEDWDPEILARHVGYLPQDSALLAGTIRDNISRFSEHRGCDREEVDAGAIAAAKAAGAHDMILQLPGGYDCVLGPYGQGLSAGQSQRVALARALYGDPILLILDEPNAHLDPEGQMALMSAMKAAKERHASVVIAAHRSNALAFVDYLLVIRAGRIEAFGPAKEVAARFRPPGAPPSRSAG